MEEAQPDDKPTECDESRRDFLKLTATSVGVVGFCAAAWPFINSMNPAADTMAVANIEIDISKAFTAAFKQITEIPIFNEFDSFTIYNDETIALNNLYIVKAKIGNLFFA